MPRSWNTNFISTHPLLHHCSIRLIMSAEARPVTDAQFAQAIEDLPLENIYTKASEIQNSIAHLQRSNAQLQEYSDSIKNDTSLEASVRSAGDRDCLEAIEENNIVVDRQLKRINLLKQEVERRGGRWHEQSANGSGEGAVDGPEQHEAPVATQRLTDEELRRRLQEQMAEDDSNNDEAGMHL